MFLSIFWTVHLKLRYAMESVEEHRAEEYYAGGRQRRIIDTLTSIAFQRFSGAMRAQLQRDAEEEFQ